MYFGEDILIAHNFGEVPRPNLPKPAGLTIRIDSAAGEEGRDGSVVPIVGPVRCVILFLETLCLLLLVFLGGIDDAGCDSPKCTPYYRARAEGPARILAGQRDKRIATPFAPSHGIGQAEDVSDSIARSRITKTQWSRGQAAREKLAAESADGGAAE